ncbi:MAG TPA: Na+/H+ antiporter subunit B [Verrucomicrobiales bacterium]|nr:Na+/H+ antiporter subunit B [Verrucomicrobiales bacterium]
MDSLILRAAARIIMPLQLAFSIVLLVRGHNEPGGGFIGGLVAACGIALHGIAFGIPAARRLLRVPPPMLIGTGLLIAALSGLPGLFQGQPFLTGLWGGSVPTLLAGQLKFGTPLLFDVGVYLVVAGIAVHLIFTMAEDQ